jgi:dienelactone hydrolase
MLDDAPIYLREEGGPAFLALLHRPTGAPSGTAVVLVPPFGYDHLCSYRSIRAWGRQLAAEGHTALRLDLPGTGDSEGGPRDPGLVGRWTGAIATAARLLREEDGVGRVVAIGLGLGGLLAHQAVADGAPIDDLVLWAAPARGRAFLREQRAFARLGVAAADESYVYPPTMPPLPEGALETGGFLLAPETCATLQAMEAGPLPAPGGRRALLLTREDFPVDARLEAALRDSGVDVTVEPGPGWTAMLEAPHFATPPLEVFATTSAWLSVTSAQEDRDGEEIAPAAPVQRLDALELDGVVERPVHIDTAGGRIFAIVAQPHGVPVRGRTAVLLNVGAERRIGANRMWTEVARRWAARGVPTVRVDLLGMGDADGLDQLAGLARGHLYDAHFLEQLTAVLDHLAERGLPPRFIVAGICSGAYWSFQLALADARVAVALPINARLLLFDAELAGEEEDMRRRDAEAPALAPATSRPSRSAQARERVYRLAHHPRLDRARVAARHPAARAVIRKAWGLTTRGDDLDRELDLLRDRGQVVTLRFTPGEALLLELERENRLARARRRWPNFSTELIDGPPETHTLQVVRMQPHVHDLLDASLDAELAR